MDWKGGGGRFGNHEQHQRQIGLMSVEGPLVKCTEQQLVRNSGGGGGENITRVGVAILLFARRFTFTRSRSYFEKGRPRPYKRISYAM